MTPSDGLHPSYPEKLRCRHRSSEHFRAMSRIYHKKPADCFAQSRALMQPRCAVRILTHRPQIECLETPMYIARPRLCLVIQKLVALVCPWHEVSEGQRHRVGGPPCHALRAATTCGTRAPSTAAVVERSARNGESHKPGMAPLACRCYRARSANFLFFPSLGPFLPTCGLLIFPRSKPGSYTMYHTVSLTAAAADACMHAW